MTQLVACLVLLVVASASATTHFVHWNSSNPIFRIDNTDHIIDVNAGNVAGEYDQANFICPVYKSGAATSTNAEKSIIYNVSREEYETCRITNPNPRVIAVCDEPGQLKFFTITFRSFTPTPGGMEFKPGQDYYFISTSSDTDLHRRVGGRCTTHNMKVTFKVASPDLVDDLKDKNVHVNQPRGQVVDNDDVDSFDYYYPPSEVMVSEIETNDIGSNSKSSLEGKGVIKQEASRMQHDELGRNGGQGLGRIKGYAQVLTPLGVATVTAVIWTTMWV